MATRGVFQLRKITVKYCDHSGSSKGAREFIRRRIVEFANNTPAAEVATELRPGQHPYIMGDYVTGEVKTIGIKNIPPGEIMDYALMLRNSSGRKVCNSAEKEQSTKDVTAVHTTLQSSNPKPCTYMWSRGLAAGSWLCL